MTPQQFIAKWQRVTLSERSACQQHFLDLCELLGQPKPAEADPDGTWYTFEKGVETSEDKKGWADVWMRDHFGWEYKGKHKDLKAAYQQLQLYREALENPPLMVVCDMDRFEVHTNFTGTAKHVHVFDLAGLAVPANLDILRRVFTDPDSLKPGITSEAITVEAADRFAKLADGMRAKGIEPLRAAHFLMKLMFCMFGEDTMLLPPGLFGKLLDTGKANPAMLPRLLQTLFEAMAKGGVYGSDVILSCATPRAGNQHLRPRACPSRDLDRLSAMDALQRLQDARPSGFDPDRHDQTDGRDSGPLRPRASQGAGMAGCGVHRGEPAVLGWKAKLSELGEQYIHGPASGLG